MRKNTADVRSIRILSTMVPLLRRSHCKQEFIEEKLNIQLNGIRRRHTINQLTRIKLVDPGAIEGRRYQ